MSIDFSQNLSFTKCQEYHFGFLSGDKSDDIHESEKPLIRTQEPPFISEDVPAIVESKSAQLLYTTSAVLSIYFCTILWVNILEHSRLKFNFPCNVFMQKSKNFLLIFLSGLLQTEYLNIYICSLYAHLNS